MSDSTRFPKILAKPHLRLNSELPGQIYTIDDFFSKSELEEVVQWTKSVQMDAPKKPGKGEAERTARRGTVDSLDIAQIILDALQPHLLSLDPPYNPATPLLSPNIRVYHYPTGTFFRGHYDSPQMDARSKRLSCWTVLVYLSSGVKGGGTTFWLDDPQRDEGKGKKGAKGKGKVEKTAGKGEGVASPRRMTFEPKAGRVLLHWHGVARGGCMLHEGDEVLAGDKWVLRTDVLA